MCHLVHYIKKIIADSLFILSLYIFTTLLCQRAIARVMKSKKCSKNIVFDGDKMKTRKASLAYVRCKRYLWKGFRKKEHLGSQALKLPFLT